MSQPRASGEPPIKKLHKITNLKNLILMGSVYEKMLYFNSLISGPVEGPLFQDLSMA